MHGAVMLDERGNVVRPALIWCDVRTNPQCRELTEKIGAAQLIQATCNPALANFTLTKLMWVREHEPENWKRVRWIMLPKDYVRWRMTGERAIDMADASGTLLLDATAIDESLLPALFESPDVCGKITAEGAKALGLRPGTPVVAGAGDQAAGAVGMGIVSPGTVSATIGTSGVVFAATDRPALEPGGRLHTFCHAIPGRCDAGRGIVPTLVSRSIRRRKGRRPRSLRAPERRGGESSGGVPGIAVDSISDGRTHPAP
jgi:xylulokinase